MGLLFWEPDDNSSQYNWQTRWGAWGGFCCELTRKRGETWAMQAAREVLEALAFCASQQAA